MMKLTNENYFSAEANQQYMSVSQFKAFEKCQASALAEINGEYEREKSTALLVGGYIDAYFEGTLSDFIKHNPECIKSDLSLKSDFVKAHDIIDRIKRDKLFMEYMSGKKQVIMTGIINGVAVKIKVDILHDDKIVDSKIMKDFEPIWVEDKGRMPWYDAWGYDLQGAVYQEVVFQNTGKRLPFYLAAATKEKTTDIDIVHLDQDRLDFALHDRFEANVELFDAIKHGIISPDRCEKCEYCKNTKVLTEPTEAEELFFE